jgi:GTPase SAR1 family protein
VPDPSSDYLTGLNIGTRDTGSWISSNYHRYCTWMESADSFLWIYGSPGCGKTILSSLVIEDVLRLCDTDSSTVLAYFYFNHHDTRKRSAEIMLRSLIVQLSKHCKQLVPVLETLFAAAEAGCEPPGAEKLLDELQKLLLCFTHTFIILDGLDESIDQDLLPYMIERILNCQIRRVHLMTTSRAYPSLEQRFESMERKLHIAQKIEMNTSPIVIAVMGLTGAGKSSFIRRITGDQSIRVGDRLHSGKHTTFKKSPKCIRPDRSTETEEVTSYRYSYGGKTFRLIDTPGFDDSRFGEDIIVEKILEWLRNSSAQGTTLNGIIYIHPITKPRIGGTASSNIRMFKQLCGNDFYQNVVLATTFWDDIDLSEGARREKELCENDEFWGILKRRGSRVVRLGLDHRKDQRLLLEIAEQEKYILQSQKEIQESKNISDTVTAKEEEEDIRKLRRSYSKHIKCRRVSVPRILCCGKCARVIRPRRDRFYRK